MTTAKFEAGDMLIARYKGRQYSCEVILYLGKLHYVFPSGGVFRSPSGAAKAVTANRVNGNRFWSKVTAPDITREGLLRAHIQRRLAIETGPAPWVASR